MERSRVGRSDTLRIVNGRTGMCVTEQIDATAWAAETSSLRPQHAAGNESKRTPWGWSSLIRWLFVFVLIAAIPVVGQAQDDVGGTRSSDRSGLKLPSRQGNESHSTPRSKSSTAGGLWTTVISLGAIIGCLLVVGHLLRPYLGAPRTLSVDALEMLGRRAIDSKVSIHLVRCGGRVLVLSVSPEGARTLSEITDPHEVQHLIEACGHSSVADRPSLGLVARPGKVSSSPPSEGQRRAS